MYSDCDWRGGIQGGKAFPYLRRGRNNEGEMFVRVELGEEEGCDRHIK